jgi:prophage tail gpP-like protein
MRDKAVDRIEISIAGLKHQAWESYEIDSDLLTPADAFRVTLAQTDLQIPAGVIPGAPVIVSMVSGDNGRREVIMRGVLDSREHSLSKRGHDLILSGRDGAGVLLDCSGPIISGQQLTLDQVVAKIVSPLGIPSSRIRIDAQNARTREKINTEPGDTAWDSLRRAAEANGLWPWFEPDGTLVIGGPRYDQAPVATLTLDATDATRNNVLQIKESYSLAERFSEVTVLGQAHASGFGAGQTAGRHNVRAVVKDSGVSGHRPKTVVDHEAINEAIAAARGRKIISDGRLKSYTITALVAGHRMESGQLWQPGQRVALRSQPLGLDGVYFLMARRFSSNKNAGQTTQLTLKEDGVWTLDAHPSQRKHRRGKNSVPGKVIDVAPGAAR